MNFLKPSTDFFGPKASEYRDYNEASVEFHLIPQCGIRLVKAIDNLASVIASSKSHPSWQNRDGSIDFEKLPWEIKVQFVREDFDDKGYINLDRIHIYSVDTLLEQSANQRASRKPNYCVLPGKGCMSSTHPMRYVTTCAALAYRLIEGRSFDVRRHTYGKVLQQTVDSRMELKEYSELFTLKFAPIWSYARELKAQKESSSLYYICSGVAALFFILFKRPSCLQG
ncbi:MAG: hypothetical protein KFB93_07155 [Simkaniaceae bacterium]|nr:MAG: hypothetical protein KFB93_07155 [Simkaniaceae bacterium]